MAGVKNLRKIQLGVETTAGTAVAATALWRGEGVGTDTTTVEFPPEDVGILGGTDRAYIPMVGGELTMEGPATYEQLPYIFEAGVAAEVGTVDSGTSATPYIYEYIWASTAQPTLKTYTIEAGDDQQAEEIAHCFVREFTLSGNAGEVINLSAVWQGRQWSTTTYTGAISIPAVDEILFQKAKLYIDDTGTYPATTQKSNTFLAFELSATTGLQAVNTGDGNLYFSFVKCTGPEVVLSVTFEHDTAGVAEKAAWRAGTARSVRIEVTGPAAGATPGDVYTNKTLFIDLIGKWETFDSLGDQDGNDTLTGTLRCRYNGTNSTMGKFTVVNALSSLT